MEVIVQDVKTEVEPLLDENSPGEDHKFNINTSNHSNSSGGVTRVFTNSKVTTIQQQQLHQQSNNLTNNSLTSQHQQSQQGGIQYISTTSGAGGVVTPVRITGQQIQTMAKSSGLSIVHVTLPQSVIQSPSVIQSASGQLLSKGVILVSKPNSSVIQTAGGGIQAVQVHHQSHPHSDESLSNDGVDHPGHHHQARGSGDRRRRDILTRRPSYRKILNDLGGSEITGDKGDSTGSSESSQDPLDSGGSGNLVIGGSQYPQSSVVKVLNANLGLSGATTADGGPATALQTITMTNAGTGGTIVQYAQSQDGQQFFVPVGSGDLTAYTIRPVSSASSSPSMMHGGSMSSGHHVPEEATRKREIRLLKNREAARECRRKKKEYIKCLENRVAVLENQNKALIDELKSLKELYCQTKTE